MGCAECGASSGRQIERCITTPDKRAPLKPLDCARYLNHTSVMLGDHRRVAASHYLNMMVRTLFDELKHIRAHSRSPADR